MNYAIIENGIVQSIIVWDGKAQWEAPTDASVVQIPDGADVGIGSTYDGAVFGAPPQPPEVTA